MTWKKALLLAGIACCVAVPIVIFAGQFGLISSVFTVGVSTIIFFIAYVIYNQ